MSIVIGIDPPIGLNILAIEPIPPNFDLDPTIRSVVPTALGVIVLPGIAVCPRETIHGI